MNVRVRDMTDADESACADIFARAWAHAFPHHVRAIDEDVFLRETDGELVLVAEQDGRVTGFAAIFEPESFLHHLYVDPALHKRGTGRALLDAARARCAARLSLKVQSTNESARAFYAHLGYGEYARGADEYGVWILLKAPD